MATYGGPKFASIRIAYGQQPSREETFFALDASDENEAVQAVLNEVATTADVGGIDLPISAADGQAVSDTIWEVTVKWGQGNINVSDPEQISLGFDTTGGRAKVTQSLSTTAYVASGTAPDTKGAIGVTKTSIEGVDVILPALSRTVKRQLLVLSNDYINALADLTGHYNADAFMGRAPGEVRFDGATGDQQQVGQPVDVTYKFSISPNVSGLTVAGIGGIDKLGWQYLWVLYEEVESNNFLVPNAVAVYVEDLPNCQPRNFTSALGFSVS